MRVYDIAFDLEVCHNIVVVFLLHQNNLNILEGYFTR